MVVFEDLYNNDIKIATHSDLTDTDQTIQYPARVHLLKLDNFYKTKRLSGVKYSLFKKSDSIIDDITDNRFITSDKAISEDMKQHKLSEDDLFIGEFITDENGEINVDNLTLGDYYFIETASVGKYIVDNTPIEFSMASYSNPKIIELTAYNDKVGTLNIRGRRTPTWWSKKYSSPRTNDYAKPFIFLGLMLFSVFFSLILIVLRKKILGKRGQ